MLPDFSATASMWPSQSQCVNLAADAVPVIWDIDCPLPALDFRHVIDQVLKAAAAPLLDVWGVDPDPTSRT